MNLWLIRQDKNRGYDTYDSAVVAALTEKEARETHPAGSYSWDGKAWKSDDGYSADTYTWTDPENVKAVLIGAAASEELSVYCASFNAG
jgi:hypothetical protein